FWESRVSCAGRFLSLTTIVSAIRSWTQQRLGWVKYWTKPKPPSNMEAPYPKARSIDCQNVMRSWTSETTRIPTRRFPRVRPSARRVSRPDDRTEWRGSRCSRRNANRRRQPAPSILCISRAERLRGRCCDPGCRSVCRGACRLCGHFRSDACGCPENAGRVRFFPQPASRRRDRQVPCGSWSLRQQSWGQWGEQSDDDSIHALRKALDLGLNFIDTAAGYGNGRSEQLIARVLKERGSRDQVIVATKTPPAPGDWPPSPYCRAEERFGEKYLRENIEERLKNLATDRIDVLQLHTWTRAWNAQPLPLQTLEKLRKEGKVRFFGLSTPEQDQNCVVELMQHGLLDVVQVIYNIFEQEPAAQLLP